MEPIFCTQVLVKPSSYLYYRDEKHFEDQLSEGESTYYEWSRTMLVCWFDCLLCKCFFIACNLYNDNLTTGASLSRAILSYHDELLKSTTRKENYSNHKKAKIIIENN